MHIHIHQQTGPRGVSKDTSIKYDSKPISAVLLVEWFMCPISRGCFETISGHMMIRYREEKLGHRQLQLIGNSTERAGNNSSISINSIERLVSSRTNIARAMQQSDWEKKRH